MATLSDDTGIKGQKMENSAILAQRVGAGILHRSWAKILCTATDDELITFINLCTAARLDDDISRKALAVAFPSCGGAHAIANYLEISGACAELLPACTVDEINRKAPRQLYALTNAVPITDVERQLLIDRQRSPLGAARVAARYSIRKLAEVSGVAESTIVSIERGYATPRIDDMRALADCLNVSLDTLLPPKRR